jgi:hypothetical protein
MSVSRPPASTTVGPVCQPPSTRPGRQRHGSGVSPGCLDVEVRSALRRAHSLKRNPRSLDFAGCLVTVTVVLLGPSLAPGR